MKRGLQGTAARRNVLRTASQHYHTFRDAVDILNTSQHLSIGRTASRTDGERTARERRVAGNATMGNDGRAAAVNSRRKSAAAVQNIQFTGVVDISVGSGTASINILDAIFGDRQY